MRQKFSTSMHTLAAVAAAVVLVAAPVRAQELQIKEQVTDSYTVQKGDTLWGIAGKFLKEPWRWPEIWRLNKEQIKNPHRIYPGDVIVLDKDKGQWRLSVAPATRVSPTVRISPLGNEAIPSVPPGDIEPYLSYPLVTGPEGLYGAAEIIAGRDQRVVRGDGDTIYATGIDPKAGTVWRLYRPGVTYTSPGNEEDILGYEQQFLGTARVERFADVSTLRIVRAREEILVGDLLIPAPPEQILNYAPHPPDRPINGQIIRLNRDAAEAGRGWTVTIDKGAADGIDVGTVLAIYQVVAPIPDPRPNKNPWLIWRWMDPTLWYQPEAFVNVPDERIGLLFIFRVFDRVSYGLVLNTTDPVENFDWVRKP
jgi:LysM domain-containing protein